MTLRKVLRALVLGAIAAGSVPAGAEEADMVNRPVNSSGMTGLIATAAPFTVPQGTLELAVSAMSETSFVPEFTLTEHPFSITYGLLDNMEVAIRGSYLYREDKPDSMRIRGAGDSELSIKWNVVPQTEGSLFPAVSFILSGLGLSGDRDASLNRVRNWGSSVGISIGRDIAWAEHVLGIYAEGRIVVEDLNRIELRDRYAVANAGILLPISKSHNLQIMLEYGITSGKRIMSDQVFREQYGNDDPDGGDNAMVTYGIRLVTERFNLTVGNQMIRKELEGFDTSGRVIGTISYKI